MKTTSSSAARGKWTAPQTSMSSGGQPATSADAALKDKVQRQADLLSGEVADLRNLGVAFERWHHDMIALTCRSRDMQDKGEELVSIARSLIVVALNAAIEAARAGESAKAFAVVAAEVKNLALRAQRLSNNLGDALHKSDLMTTATFQDVQAGGKMMMAAISGLEAAARRVRSTAE